MGVSVGISPVNTKIRILWRPFMKNKRNANKFCGANVIFGLCALAFSRRLIFIIGGIGTGWHIFGWQKIKLKTPFGLVWIKAEGTCENSKTLPSLGLRVAHCVVVWCFVWIFRGYLLTMRLQCRKLSYFWWIDEANGKSRTCWPMAKCSYKLYIFSVWTHSPTEWKKILTNRIIQVSCSLRSHTNLLRSNCADHIIIFHNLNALEINRSDDMIHAVYVTYLTSCDSYMHSYFATAECCWNGTTSHGMKDVGILWAK